MFDVNPVTTSRTTACGPACLNMLLAFCGVDVALDQLIRECGVGVAGATAGDLKRCAALHGVELLAYRMPADELIKIDRPAIIWWKYQHFCVFCGLDGAGNVVICNPGRGRYGIDRGSFAALYTGVALTNGEPEDLPEPPPDETGDLAEAARILLGVSE